MKRVSEKEAYENLANAIIIFAFKDLTDGYTMRNRGLRANPKHISEVKRFLHSDWFKCLTDIDPLLIDMRAQQLANQKAKKAYRKSQGEIFEDDEEDDEYLGF